MKLSEVRGFAHGASELVDVLVHRTSGTFWRGQMYQGGRRVPPRGSDFHFSDDFLATWLDECHVRAYKRGTGTWTTAEVHIYPDRPGRLDLFEEEILERMPDGHWYPRSTSVWSRSLGAAAPRVSSVARQYSRLDVGDFSGRGGKSSPPLQPRAPVGGLEEPASTVTDRGTDFAAEPIIIDPSLEPGVFAKISKKLFGA